MLAPLLLACAKPAAPQPAAPQPAALQPAALQPAVSADPLACERGGELFGPVLLPAEQAAARHGLGQADLAALSISQARPVEVCGVDAQLDWLLAARCGDGSAPFTDRAVAHAARQGNVGPGGRCDSIIDHYVVPCPEATYDVYMDLYMCGPGESF